MDIDNLVAYLTDFYYSHTVVAIALVVVIVILVIFRPKAMLKTAGMIVALAVVAYLMSLAIDMAGSGRSQKEEAIQTVR
ncbi:MAG: hypothetical protein PVF97_11595 [Desulfobacterales bacterium]|jgi:amino acid permease